MNVTSIGNVYSYLEQAIYHESFLQMKRAELPQMALILG